MNLQRFRREKRLTQKDLADMVGVDAATISRAEVGHPSARLETYRMCAQALGVSLASIFSEPLTAEEAALLSLFRAIPESGRAKVRAILELAQASPPEKD